MQKDTLKTQFIDSPVDLFKRGIDVVHGKRSHTGYKPFRVLVDGFCYVVVKGLGKIGRIFRAEKRFQHFSGWNQHLDIILITIHDLQSLFQIPYGLATGN